MEARERLIHELGLLSDYECQHLLPLLERVAGGARFWEGDFGHLYNEYVKVRYFNLGRHPPAAPSVEHGAFVPMALVKAYPNATRILLPPPGRIESSLSETMLERRSRREYADDSIDLDQLSTLLHHAAGVTAFAPAYGLRRLPLRTFPSHGGLQSPEVYVAARATRGLSPGLYHYHPMDHALEQLDEIDHAAHLRELSFDEEFVERASVVFLLTGYYERLRWKYGERAYRFMCMDVGFIGQNLYLAAEGTGLSACAVSGFAQDAVEDLLQLDGKDEIALLLLTLGVPPAGVEPPN